MAFALPSPSSVWRWLAVLVALATLVVSSRLGTRVAVEHASAFTPAPYAFGIWGVIYATIGAHVLIQLRAPEGAACDRLTRPAILVGLVSIIWFVAFARGYLWSSVVLSGVMFGLATLLHIRATSSLAAGASRWSRVPFSLLLGWLGVTSLATIAAGLVASDVRVDGAIAIALVALLGAFGVYVGLAAGDTLVPGVVVWATLAIAVADRDREIVTAVAALSAMVGCLVTCVVLGLERRTWRPPPSRPGLRLV